MDHRDPNTDHRKQANHLLLAWEKLASDRQRATTYIESSDLPESDMARPEDFDHVFAKIEFLGELAVSVRCRPLAADGGQYQGPTFGRRR
jgi:hypothetical protein